MDDLEAQMELAITHIKTLTCLLFDCYELFNEDGEIDGAVWRALVVSALQGDEDLYERMQDHPEGRAVEKQVRAMLRCRMRDVA